MWPFTNKAKPGLAIEHADSFYVQHGEGAERPSVEAWSAFRIPFEARKDEEFVLRKALQGGLDEPGMQPTAELQGRHVIYSASEQFGHDNTENDALCNIGRWTRVTGSEPVLRFERRLTPPTKCPVAMKAEPRCSWHYSTAPSDSGFACWQETRPKHNLDICMIKFGQCSEFNDSKRVWHTVRSAMKESPGFWRWTTPSREYFGLLVHILIPHGELQAQRTIDIKPVFDGVLAALQYYEGPDKDEVAGRLAEYLQKPTSEIADLLEWKKGCNFGASRLFIPQGEGLQVTPHDDRCVAGELRLWGSPLPAPRLHICLFKVKPV